jgi:hypothetical protein
MALHNRPKVGATRGDCDEDRISISHIVRFNLTVRMMRLTNGHSKSLRHHTVMQALFVAWYNFARRHEALKGNTPAMASVIRFGRSRN